MLLSLTEKATFFLHPDYIAAAKQTGVLNKAIIYKEVVSIEKNENSSDINGVIEALRELLKKPEWRDCNSQVVLSGEFTKFRIVRWNDNLSKEEKKIRVQNELEEIYASNGEALKVFITDNGFRKNSLAFAMEESFYKALRDLENEHLLKLNAIIPYFILIANWFSKSIDKNAWLVIKVNRFINVAMLRNHSWELIKIEIAKQNWVQELKHSLSREMMQLNDIQQNCQLFFHEEFSSSESIELIKNIDKNIKVLGRNLPHETNSKLVFASYLI